MSFFGAMYYEKNSGIYFILDCNRDDHNPGSLKRIPGNSSDCRPFASQLLFIFILLIYFEPTISNEKLLHDAGVMA